MSDNDPFANREGTILKPTPRGAPQGRTERGPPPPPGGRPPGGEPVGRIAGTGANPILAAATELITVGSQLSRTLEYSDTRALFDQLCVAIRQFERELAADGFPSQTTSVARYVLCGFLDEAILNTPWGGHSDWSAHSLLAEFHNELDAGRKLFEVLDRLLQDPARHVDLIELVYVCLSLGFQGMYRRRAQGARELEQIRLDTFEAITRIRDRPERELSPHWRGLVDQRPGLVRYVPWWVIVAVAAGVLVLGYFLLLRSLNADSDPVVGDIAKLGRDLPAVHVDRAPAAMPVGRLHLTELLQAEIAAGQIDAGANPDTVIIRELFPSGSATIAAQHQALMRRMAAVLLDQNGTVRISGHTDNVPIRTLRFPSNWDLSRDRAQAVLHTLANYGVPERRMIAEPMADTEPLCASCDQNAPDVRASNRRVEIELKPGVSGQ